jgi:hypothetical protein
VGEARDDSLPDGIGKPRNDDRNRRRRILGRQGRWRSPGQDQIHVQPNQFSRQSRVSFVSAVGRSVLDDEILPLDVSELLQTPPEGLEIGRIRLRRRPFEHTDPVCLPYLLRLGGERRGEETARQGADERPPIHYSIT